MKRRRRSLIQAQGNTLGHRVEQDHPTLKVLDIRASIHDLRSPKQPFQDWGDPFVDRVPRVALRPLHAGCPRGDPGARNPRLEVANAFGVLATQVWENPSRG